MRIVSRYKSIIGKGFDFEDGTRDQLRRVGLSKNGDERFEFEGSNYYINIDAMRVLDEKTETAIDNIDISIMALSRRLSELRQLRRQTIEKAYNKSKKIYKWDLEA